MNWEPLLLTFKLALFTTAILIVIGIPVAYWLSNTKSRLKPVFETLVSMPLVLPPTVLGFYFLMAFKSVCHLDFPKTKEASVIDLEMPLKPDCMG